MLTNSYTFIGDADIDSVTLGADDFEFVISARQEKKASVAVFQPYGSYSSVQHVCMRLLAGRSSALPLIPFASGKVQAPEVHLQAQGIAPDRPVPMHGSCLGCGQMPPGCKSAWVSS